MRWVRNKGMDDPSYLIPYFIAVAATTATVATERKVRHGCPSTKRLAVGIPCWMQMTVSRMRMTWMLWGQMKVCPRTLTLTTQT